MKNVGVPVHVSKAAALGWIPIFSGICAALIGISVMVGWHAGSTVLISLNPSYSPMQYQTALGFLLCGGGLVCVCLCWHRLARACAIAIGLLMLVSFYEYFSTNALGNALAEYMQYGEWGPFGNIAPNTMLCLLCAGVCLYALTLAADTKQRRFFLALILVVMFTISIAALTGYLLSNSEAYGWGYFTHMALHSAVAIVVFSVGAGVYVWQRMGKPAICSISLVIPVLCIWGVLVFDLITPPEIMIALLYALTILFAFTFHHPYAPFILAGVTVFLTLLAYFDLSRETLDVHVFINRLLSTLAQLVVAFVVYNLKQAKIGLEQSRDQLEATLMSVFGAIITIDHQGFIRLFNPMAERIFGYTAAEVMGEKINILMPEPYHSQHDHYLSHYQRTGERKVIGIGREVMGRRKDGTVFPIELGVSETKIGDKLTFVGLVHDITTRKAAEVEVERRTKELERSNHELDEFAYIASHDLKEPLRGIHNYASFLLEDYQDTLAQDGQDKLKTMVTLTQRLEDLINSLLYFSRVGRSEVAIQQVDLNAVLEEVLFSLQATITATGTDIRIPAPLPVQQCDVARTGEIFRNLITNAIKYNESEQKWVEIGMLPPKDTGIITFYVRDNGIGILAKHQQVIFRIFKRLHARNAYGDGTGVGLTIVEKIVSRHGGRIWVESTPGEGSTFYFTLAKEEGSPQ